MRILSKWVISETSRSWICLSDRMKSAFRGGPRPSDSARTREYRCPRRRLYPSAVFSQEIHLLPSPVPCNLLNNGNLTNTKLSNSSFLEYRMKIELGRSDLDTSWLSPLIRQMRKTGVLDAKCPSGHGGRAQDSRRGPEPGASAHAPTPWWLRVGGHRPLCCHLVLLPWDCVVRGSVHASLCGLDRH